MDTDLVDQPDLLLPERPEMLLAAAQHPSSHGNKENTALELMGFLTGPTYLGRDGWIITPDKIRPPEGPAPGEEIYHGMQDISPTPESSIGIVAVRY